MGNAKSSGSRARPEAGPQTQLALPLQCRRLDVGAADQDEVAIQVAVVLVGEVDVVAGVMHPFALGSEQLDALDR